MVPGDEKDKPGLPEPDDDPSLTEEPAASEAELAEVEAALKAEDDEASSDAKAEGEPDKPDEPDELDEDGVDEEAHMSLLDHLGELRVRLTRSLIAIFVGTILCYSVADEMFDILMEPMVQVFQEQAADNPIMQPGFYDDLRRVLGEMMAERGVDRPEQVNLFVDALQKSLGNLSQEGHFQYTYPAEAFFSYIKIAIVAGLFLVSPYIFAQIWGFIAPGLYAHERKWMIPMATLSALFFTGGALFGYFQVFPHAFDFFAGFSNEGIQFTPKLNEYLSFCLKLLFAFGFVFELPLFIFFLARMGLVSSTGLRQKRKYAILTGFILAAVLTPPNPFTQCLMAGPLIVLYEVGVWVAYFFGKNEKRHAKKREEEAAAKQAELDKAAESSDEAEKT